MIGSKSALAIILSRMEGFSKPKIQNEQYMTPSEIAAEVLWNLSMAGRIKDKNIADLGCGTGILGLGAALLGAHSVTLLDKDTDAITVAKHNLMRISDCVSAEISFITSPVDGFFVKDLDLVIQNPPFGVKVRNADRPFLKKAMELSPHVVSFHMSSTQRFLGRFADKNGFAINAVTHFRYGLPARYAFHEKRMKYLDVGCFEFLRK